MTPNIILELVDRFERDIERYKSDTYNEAQLRQDFLNPMFKELGWDVYHELPATLSHREVKVEVPVKLGTERGFLDYAFCVDGRAKFVVEAKKPWVDVSNNVDAAKQLRRYGWNQKLGLSMLTNFREFAIYDCTKKPSSTDKAQDYRLKYFSFTDLRKEENWKWIAERFSKSAVLGGFLDEFAAKKSGKRGSAQVDDSLLQEIDSWRAELAANIYKKNEGIEVDDLNYIIGKIIDRIIFLRVCEDRGIEPYETLLKLVQKGGVYPRLVEYFYKADERYNSGLFYFKGDAKRGADPDLTTPFLKVDDVVLQSIVRGLYYPKSQFLFSEIPIEILGHVYEQFLGKVITLEGKGKRKSVEIDYKPEVRKAGGVYYTPTYIVDYIVKHTVGKLVEGKTPGEVSKLRVLDPACGSGSFLIGAYQFLLDWYLEQYTKIPSTIQSQTPSPNPLPVNGEGGPESSREARPSKVKGAKGKREPIYDSGSGWRLTLEERKRILLDNIYGVDIDAQAVEVTKLSLLLKVLENASPAEIETELSAKHHALPDLGNNIKCGNSLVGFDIQKQFPDLSDEEIERINPFDWQAEFKDVFKQGGFDAVIGNPPYIKEYTSREPFEYFKQSGSGKYYQGKMDIWYAFSCVAVDIMKKSGLHAFIATNNWLTNAGATILRRKIAEECDIVSLVDFGPFKVFESAGIQTAIFVAKKRQEGARPLLDYKRVSSPKASEHQVSSFMDGVSGMNIGTSFRTSQPVISDERPFSFTSSESEYLLDKIEKAGPRRLSAEEVGTGIDVHQDFVNAKHLKLLPRDSAKQGEGIFIVSESERNALKLSKKELELLKPYYTTNELGRFWGNSQNSYWVIYTTTEIVKSIDQYPKLKAHFDRFRKIITSDNKPYGLHRAREQRLFEGEKIVSLRKTKMPCFTYTDFPCYVSQTYFSIKPKDIGAKYLTGVLNSNLSLYWLTKRGKLQGNLLQVDKEPLLRFPIRTINFKDKADKARHDRMVKLVERMLELNKKLPEQKTPLAREKLERQIAATDREIDELVYELYNLTPEEIAIVEGNNK